MNNYTLKHIFHFISSIYPGNHWSWLDTLSEIVFIKGRLNAMGYQEMLHGELFPFTIEIEDKKIIFQRHNALVHTVATKKKYF